MKKILIIFIVVPITIVLGGQFGASIYYYFATGEFQSSVLDMTQSQEELVLRGIFSSIFSFLPIMLLKKNIAIDKLLRYYFYGAIFFFSIYILADWKTTSNFNLSGFLYILRVLFMSTEMYCFLIVGAINAMFLIGNEKDENSKNR